MRFVGFVGYKNLAITCLVMSLALASAGFAAVVASTPGSSDGCADQGIKEIKSEIKYGPMQECGSGLRFQAGPVTLHTPTNHCPTFAVYEPVRHLPTHKPGFYTKPSGKVPVMAFTFQCVESWLLGFIPIPISSTCELKRVVRLDGIQTYVEDKCKQPAGEAKMPTVAAGSTDGGE